MPIAVVCPHCQTDYALADHLAGKKVRCKNCDGIIVVRATAGGSGQAERIQKEPRSSRAAARDEDEDRPRRRDREKAPRSGGNGLMIVLICSGAGLLLLLLVCGGGGAYFLMKKGAAVGADLDGPWPEPVAPPQVGALPPELTVTIHVAGADDEFTREDVSGRLSKLVDAGGGSRMVSSSFGNRTTILLSPVRDPQAFANRIDFATVRGVNGRIVTIVARKVEGAPPANADAVTKALFDLKSDLPHKRREAARVLKDTLPDQRRGEVVKALEPLLNDNGPFTREWAIEALGVWGTKETTPLLLKAMQQKEGRGAAMKALARLKDERAAEPIAERLDEFFDRHEAAEALKKMGPVAEDAVIKRLNHADNQVRMTACDILKAIGTAKSLPPLQGLIAEGDFILKHKAEEATKAIKARQR